VRRNDGDEPPIPRQPKPTRLKAPKFATLSGAELHRLFNVAGHELAGSTYLFLLGQSVLAGKYKGYVHTSIDTLRSLLRPPKPEKGQWPAAPSVQRVRTCLSALEKAGLIERDAAQNAALKQLRMWLTQRRETRSS
jgi:hypothetical protein